MAKSNLITRKVIGSRTYHIFSLDGGDTTLLDTIKIKGKPSLKALAKKYHVSQVVAECVATTEEVYAMDIPEFMKHAVLIHSETK